MNKRWLSCLEFVEGGNVDTLHLVFVLFDFFGQVVSTDFLVLNNRGDHELEDAKGEWLFLVFFAPHESVHGDLAFDFDGERVQVGLVVERDHRFSGDGALGGHLCGFFSVVGGHTLGFHSLGFLVNFVVVGAEEVHVVIVFFVFGFLFFGGWRSGNWSRSSGGGRLSSFKLIKSSKSGLQLSLDVVVLFLQFYHSIKHSTDVVDGIITIGGQLLLQLTNHGTGLTWR